MEIIKSQFIEGAGYEFDLAAYPSYLDTVRERLPPNALAFAEAPWHYKPADPRCPHDSWVEQVQISEPSRGQRNELRGIDLLVRLLGAYHDRHIEIRYGNVHHYTMEASRSEGATDGHGDWLIDEVRLSPTGTVLHEMQFVHARWIIECDDLSYSWRDLLQ